MVEIGAQAPNFNLVNHKREQVSLESFRGRTVVLAFYPAAFTGVCEKEMCTFRDSLAALNAVNAAVLGISVDAPFSNAAFAEKNQINFPLLSDYGRTTVKAYGVELPDFAKMPGYTAAQRSVFVVDKAGAVRYKWVAPNPGVEPNYDEVRKAVEASK
jgi:peroxiredoxin